MPELSEFHKQVAVVPAGYFVQVVKALSHELTLMIYEEIELEVAKDTARREIMDRIDDVQVTIDDDRIEYHTNAGFLLAVLTDTRLSSGETGTRLRYRTAILSSQLIHARTKADQIRRAVERFRID